MSKEVRMIALNSDIYCGCGKDKQEITSRGHRCDYCNGNGFFYGLDEFSESVREPCPRCGGSGLLDAHITIRWRPSKIKDE